MDDLTIITTSDGSHSLLHTKLNETYHSTHGAIQESLHVFIKHGFDFFVEKNKPTDLNIFEMGFGTGLNVLLTLQHVSGMDIKVNYTSLEAFPISQNVVEQLNYPEALNRAGAAEQFNTLHQLPWNKEVEVHPNFLLTKVKNTLEDVDLRNKKFDIVFYDAFAPSKQPELWTLSSLAKVTDALNPQGVFVTYCAKGQLKRDLKSLALIVETLPGPPGKKEMVRAVKTTQQ